MMHCLDPTDKTAGLPAWLRGSPALRRVSAECGLALRAPPPVVPSADDADDGAEDQGDQCPPPQQRHPCLCAACDAAVQAVAGLRNATISAAVARSADTPEATADASKWFAQALRSPEGGASSSGAAGRLVNVMAAAVAGATPCDGGVGASHAAHVAIPLPAALLRAIVLGGGACGEEVLPNPWRAEAVEVLTAVAATAMPSGSNAVTGGSQQQLLLPRPLRAIIRELGNCSTSAAAASSGRQQDVAAIVRGLSGTSFASQRVMCPDAAIARADGIVCLFDVYWGDTVRAGNTMHGGTAEGVVATLKSMATCLAVLAGGGKAATGDQDDERALLTATRQLAFIETVSRKVLRPLLHANSRVVTQDTLGAALGSSPKNPVAHMLPALAKLSAAVARVAADALQVVLGSDAFDDDAHSDDLAATLDRTGDSTTTTAAAAHTAHSHWTGPERARRLRLPSLRAVLLNDPKDLCNIGVVSCDAPGAVSALLAAFTRTPQQSDDGSGVDSPTTPGGAAASTANNFLDVAAAMMRITAADGVVAASVALEHAAATAEAAADVATALSVLARAAAGRPNAARMMFAFPAAAASAANNNKAAPAVATTADTIATSLREAVASTSFDLLASSFPIGIVFSRAVTHSQARVFRQRLCDSVAKACSIHIVRGSGGGAGAVRAARRWHASLLHRLREALGTTPEAMLAALVKSAAATSPQRQRRTTRSQGLRSEPSEATSVATARSTAEPAPFEMFLSALDRVLPASPPARGGGGGGGSAMMNDSLILPAAPSTCTVPGARGEGAAACAGPSNASIVQSIVAQATAASLPAAADATELMVTLRDTYCANLAALLTAAVRVPLPRHVAIVDVDGPGTAATAVDPMEVVELHLSAVDDLLDAAADVRQQRSSGGSGQAGKSIRPAWRDACFASELCAGMVELGCEALLGYVEARADSDHDGVMPAKVRSAFQQLGLRLSRAWSAGADQYTQLVVAQCRAAQPLGHAQCFSAQLRARRTHRNKTQRDADSSTAAAHARANGTDLYSAEVLFALDPPAGALAWSRAFGRLGDAARVLSVSSRHATDAATASVLGRSFAASASASVSGAGSSAAAASGNEQLAPVAAAQQLCELIVELAWPSTGRIPALLKELAARRQQQETNNNNNNNNTSDNAAPSAAPEQAHRDRIRVEDSLVEAQAQFMQLVAPLLLALGPILAASATAATAPTSNTSLRAACRNLWCLLTWYDVPVMSRSLSILIERAGGDRQRAALLQESWGIATIPDAVAAIARAAPPLLRFRTSEYVPAVNALNGFAAALGVSATPPAVVPADSVDAVIFEAAHRRLILLVEATGLVNAGQDEYAVLRRLGQMSSSSNVFATPPAIEAWPVVSRLPFGEAFLLRALLELEVARAAAGGAVARTVLSYMDYDVKHFAASVHSRATGAREASARGATALESTGWSGPPALVIVIRSAIERSFQLLTNALAVQPHLAVKSDTVNNNSGGGGRRPTTTDKNTRKNKTGSAGRNDSDAVGKLLADASLAQLTPTQVALPHVDSAAASFSTRGRSSSASKMDIATTLTELATLCVSSSQPRALAAEAQSFLENLIYAGSTGSGPYAVAFAAALEDATLGILRAVSRALSNSRSASDDDPNHQDDDDEEETGEAAAATSWASSRRHGLEAVTRRWMLSAATAPHVATSPFLDTEGSPSARLLGARRAALRRAAAKFIAGAFQRADTDATRVAMVALQAIDAAGSVQHASESVITRAMPELLAAQQSSTVRHDSGAAEAVVPLFRVVEGLQEAANNGQRLTHLRNAGVTCRTRLPGGACAVNHDSLRDVTRCVEVAVSRFRSKKKCASAAAAIEATADACRALATDPPSASAVLTACQRVLVGPAIDELWWSHGDARLALALRILDGVLAIWFDVAAPGAAAFRQRAVRVLCSVLDPSVAPAPAQDSAREFFALGNAAFALVESSTTMSLETVTLPVYNARDTSKVAAVSRLRHQAIAHLFRWFAAPVTLLPFATAQHNPAVDSTASATLACIEDILHHLNHLSAAMTAGTALDTNSPGRAARDRPPAPSSGPDPLVTADAMALLRLLLRHEHSRFALWISPLIPLCLRSTGIVNPTEDVFADVGARYDEPWGHDWAHATSDSLHHHQRGGGGGTFPPSAARLLHAERIASPTDPRVLNLLHTLGHDATFIVQRFLRHAPALGGFADSEWRAVIETATAVHPPLVPAMATRFGSTHHMVPVLAAAVIADRPEAFTTSPDAALHYALGAATRTWRRMHVPREQDAVEVGPDNKPTVPGAADVAAPPLYIGAFLCGHFTASGPDVAAIANFDPCGVPAAFRLLSTFLPVSAALRAVHDAAPQWRDTVVAFAIRSLKSCAPEDLVDFLPQILQLMRHDRPIKPVEPFDHAPHGAMHSLVAGTAGHSERFAVSVLLALRTEYMEPEVLMEAAAAAATGEGSADAPITQPPLPKLPTVVAKRCAKLATAVVAELSEDVRKRVATQLGFVDSVIAVSGELKSVAKSQRLGLLRQLLKGPAGALRRHIEAGNPCPLVIPTALDAMVTELHPESAIALQSAAKCPILVHFTEQPVPTDINNQNGGDEDAQAAPAMRKSMSIFKYGDDCRQDQLALQIIRSFQRTFERLGVPCFLFPYRVVTVAQQCGVIECVPDTKSRDQVGKLVEGNLYDYFVATYGAPHTAAFQEARRNFVQSMAAYSVVSHLLNIKDRHNGNILLTGAGHLVHIDFGFLFDFSPGGDMNFEASPFKLTTEMLAVMGAVPPSDEDLRVSQAAQHVALSVAGGRGVGTLSEVQQQQQQQSASFRRPGDPEAHPALQFAAAPDQQLSSARAAAVNLTASELLKGQTPPPRPDSVFPGGSGAAHVGAEAELRPLSTEHVASSRDAQAAARRRSAFEERTNAYTDFVHATVQCFLAARTDVAALIGLTEPMLESGLPCFKPGKTLNDLRMRLALGVPEAEAASIMLGRVALSADNMRTNLYDRYQNMAEGIEW